MMISTSYGTVSAMKVYTQGGIWDYGVSKKYVWSHYHHNKKAHYSKVRGKYWSSSGYTPKGKWAKASAEKRGGWQVWRLNKAFYGFY